MREASRPWLLVPLDDRPCCLQFPQRLAGLETPPAELLGRFQEPGDCDRLLDWLEERAPEAAGAIVSLDMLCWGGLVASRKGGKDVAAALDRLRRAVSIRKRAGLPMLAFQVIMRNAPTQTRPEEMLWAERLVELSEACGNGDEALRSRLEGEIPARLLADTLAARRENQALYRALAGDPEAFDVQVFALDDSRRAGWNLLELQGLGPVQSVPGTDETALLLAARALAETRAVQVDWSYPELTAFQGLYEDRPLGQVLEAQLQAADLQLGESPRQLWIYGRPQAGGGAAPPRTQESQREAREQSPGPPEPAWLERLGAALDAGREIVLLDVTFANGGDLSLGQALSERGWWPRLRGYAAWNTLGNRLGTALALAALPLTRVQQQAFLLERIADDLLYQARYRWLAARRLDHPGLALSPAEERSVHEVELSALLAEWSKFREIFQQESQLSVSLPWNRLFEVEVSLQN